MWQGKVPTLHSQEFHITCHIVCRGTVMTSCVILVGLVDVKPHTINRRGHIWLSHSNIVRYMNHWGMKIIALRHQLLRYRHETDTIALNNETLFNEARDHMRPELISTSLVLFGQVFFPSHDSTER